MVPLYLLEAYLAGAGSTCHLSILPGAGNYSANTLSCESCQVGEYCVAGASVGVRCPLADSTTQGRGSKSEDQCVCQVGYFSANDTCKVCPLGTDCSSVGVTVATLPLLPNWWRLPNSTELKRCFATSNCTGGQDALELCGDGYEGPFCGLCATQYLRSFGRCEPCKGSVGPAVIAVAVTLIVLLMLGLALRRTVRGRQMLRKLEIKLHAKKEAIAEGAHDFAQDKHKAEVRGTEGSGPAQGRSGPGWLAKTWQFELPDVDLPSIEATLCVKFPELSWPELPELRLHELKLPGVSWFDFQAKHPHLEWPSVCNLAFMVNILRISLPSLVWPTLPNLERTEWDWPDWELPPVHLSVLLATLRERFPSLSWPEMPNKRLLDLRLPRLTFAEYELLYPNLAPWPAVPNLIFLFKLLRIAFPDLAWPELDLPISGPNLKLPDLSLPDWSLPEFEHPDWDLMTSSFDSLAVKLRILISMVQVLSQLSVVYSIPFPDLYTNLLRWVGLLELNFVDMLPLGCVLTLSFHKTLMMRTLLLPALSVIALLLHYVKAHTKVLEISRSLLFLVLFLIYPGTSAAIFATFQCEELSDGTRWLRADLSIDCASTVHIGFSMYAALMILVYPIGTPAFYYVLLRRSRASLNQLQAPHLSAYSSSSYVGLGKSTLT